MPRKQDGVCGATGLAGPEGNLPLEDHGRTRPEGAHSPLEQRASSKMWPCFLRYLRDKQPLPVRVHPSSYTPHSYPRDHVRTPHSPPAHETRGFEATRVSKRCSLLSDFSA